MQFPENPHFRFANHLFCIFMAERRLRSKEKKKSRARWIRSKKKGKVNPRKARLYTHPPCPHCGKVFTNTRKDCLTKHIQFYHQNVAKNMCDVCARPCHTPYQKAIHLKSHMSKEERLAAEAAGPQRGFLCTECGMKLKTRSTSRSPSFHSIPFLH